MSLLVHRALANCLHANTSTCGNTQGFALASIFTQFFVLLKVMCLYACSCRTYTVACIHFAPGISHVADILEALHSVPAVHAPHFYASFKLKACWTPAHTVSHQTLRASFSLQEVGHL